MDALVEKLNIVLTILSIKLNNLCSFLNTQIDVILENLNIILVNSCSKLNSLYLSLDPIFVGQSVSDSFTVLVGFVAIGIPLSLQVISRATEKYKSDYLIKYLSSWKFVTPNFIYWASIIYIFLALIFKSHLPTKNDNFNLPHLQTYAWILVIFFLTLVTFVGVWYGHLFIQASKTPKEMYDALKK